MMEICNLRWWSKLADIEFVDINTNTIENELIGAYEAATGEPLYPGDERRIFLMNLVPVIAAIKNSINDTGNQNLLSNARGVKLDALGELHSTTRLAAQKAMVTMRFTLSSAQPSSVTVPLGTRVTPDGVIMFATTQPLVIASGQTYADVKAEAIEAGAAYNNYAPGQIKALVDPIEYISSVSNIDTSSGGADIESDDDYRERIRQAPESFSVAGPEGAYIYLALTADSTIADISVTSPSAGVVKIVPLLVGGVVPGQAILDKITEVVSAKDKRPLTDNVQVVAPVEVTYNIDLTYYISSSRQTEETAIKEAIEGADGAIEAYKAWQSEKLGRAINPDELRYRIMKEGAYRVVLNSPVYTAVDPDKVAKIGTINVVYGGLE